MTCIHYAGGFTKIGEPDPIDDFVAQFIKEEVDFQMPKNVRSWKQKAKVNVKGQLAIKITTRIVKFKDGSEDTLVKEDRKKIEL